MSLFKFFGFLFFSGMCHLISFMALAFFSGINLEPLAKSGNAFVALMAKIPQVLLTAHVTVAPLFAAVVFGIFIFGDRAVAAGLVKYMFALPVVTVLSVVVCFYFVSKYK